MITNNDIPTGIVTNTELCRTDQFQLNYQKNSGSNFTLNSSNPGQFYYNVLTTTAGTVTMTIPYPFVTQGATSIHVYTSGNYQWNEDTQCFTDGTASAGYTTQVTLKPSYNDFGQTTTVTVAGVPAGSYVNIHLDYGLKGTRPWQKSGLSNLDAKKGSQTILNGQVYQFNNGSTTQTTTSVNKF